MKNLHDPQDRKHWGVALRAALIIIPIIGLMVTVGLKLTYDPIFESRRLRGLIFAVIFEFIFPLSYIALSLWAAHELKPIKILNMKLLKRALVFFAIFMPIQTLVKVYTPIKMVYSRDPDMIMSYVGNYIMAFVGTLVFSLLCLFAAYQTKIEEEDTEVEF